VFGIGPFPEMGIAGAAIATLLATIVQMVISIHLFVIDKSYWPADGDVVLCIDFHKFVRILRFGVPVGFSWILDILAWAIFTNLLVGQFGTAQLAASNICLQFLHLSFMPAMGIGQALAAEVGRAIGQQDFVRAYSVTDTAIGLCMIWMGFCGLVMMMFGGVLVGWMDSSIAVREAGVNIMRLAALFQLFDALAITCSHALRAAGDTLFPTYISLVGNWGVFIGGGYLMTRYFPEIGSTGPWIMATAMIICVGIVFRIRFARGSWEKINIFA
jgi:MATE family multidrug resistance protein